MAWYRQSPSPGLLIMRDCVMSSTAAIASVIVVTVGGRGVRVLSSWRPIRRDEAAGSGGVGVE